MPSKSLTPEEWEPEFRRGCRQIPLALLGLEVERAGPVPRTATRPLPPLKSSKETKTASSVGEGSVLCSAIEPTNLRAGTGFRYPYVHPEEENQ